MQAQASREPRHRDAAQVVSRELRRALAADLRFSVVREGCEAIGCLEHAQVEHASVMSCCGEHLGDQRFISPAPGVCGHRDVLSPPERIALGHRLVHLPSTDLHPRRLQVTVGLLVAREWKGCTERCLVASILLASHVHPGFLSPAGLATHPNASQFVTLAETESRPAMHLAWYTTGPKYPTTDMRCPCHDSQRPLCQTR